MTYTDDSDVSVYGQRIKQLGEGMHSSFIFLLSCLTVPISQCGIPGNFLPPLGRFKADPCLLPHQFA